MSIFATRTRLVSFRMSEKEYENFRAATIANGARSVSAFARSLAVSVIGSTSDGRQFVSKDLELLNLRLTVQDLQIRVAELAGELSRHRNGNSASA